MYSRLHTAFIKSPSGIPHSPPQKSGLYMSGDFKETGAFTPSVALSPNANSRWLKRTTASPPITPAAKQIATRCLSVNPFPITFESFSVMFNVHSESRVQHEAVAGLA